MGQKQIPEFLLSNKILFKVMKKNDKWEKKRELKEKEKEIKELQTTNT